MSGQFTVYHQTQKIVFNIDDLQKGLRSLPKHKMYALKSLDHIIYILQCHYPNQLVFNNISTGQQITVDYLETLAAAY